MGACCVADEISPQSAAPAGGIAKKNDASNIGAPKTEAKPVKVDPTAGRKKAHAKNTPI